MHTGRILSLVGLTLLFVGLLSVLSMPQTTGVSDSASAWKKVEVALGRAGKLQAGGIYRFGIPRCRTEDVGTQYCEASPTAQFRGTGPRFCDDISYTSQQYIGVTTKRHDGPIKISWWY
jgi:hypothetical protein